MNLESLANELLLDLFDFLSTAHLLRAFNGLNSRFNTLISHFIRASRRIDCRSMSKGQLDFVCQKHLPSIAHRIISLSLSDDDETPQQIDRFLSHGLKLDQFIHLRSLSFYHFRSEEIMKNIMISWCHLHHLTHLKFSECYFRYKANDVLHMVNSIWSLSKLTHCHLDITFRWRPSFVAPTVTSSSLESLFIQGIDCQLNDLTRLFQHTTRLRHLCTNISTYSRNVLLPLSVSTIISLELEFFSSGNSVHDIINLLRIMHNLRQLTVEILDIYIDGHQWKEIITNYLPKLKVFRLKMEFYFRDRMNTKQRVDQLLKSFQTCFWLEERQWFIRCHYHPKNASNYVCLYTLPYIFDSFPRIEVYGCQSTCSDDDNQSWSYDHVHILNYRASLTGDLTLYPSRFVNIQHLSLSLGVDDQFWIIVPRFDCLVSLEVSLYGHINNVRSQLQTILDRAPHLSLLKFGSWRTLELPIAEITSASVRQLDLRGCDRWLNDQECLTLINSPLGIQCEILRINVENRMSILDIITRMTNLRSLNVRCNGDKWNEELSTSNDGLVRWLQYRLPSTYIITRHTRYTSDILLWIL
jgi:hypothetical protein